MLVGGVMGVSMVVLLDPGRGRCASLLLHAVGVGETHSMMQLGLNSGENGGWVVVGNGWWMMGGLDMELMTG